MTREPGNGHRYNMSVYSSALHRILTPKGEPLQMKLRLIISWSLSGGVIQDYLGGLRVIRRTIKRGGGVRWGSRREDSTRPCWLCRCREGTVCWGEQQPPDGGRGDVVGPPLGDAGEERILPASGADPVVSVGALMCRMGRWLTCVILSRDIFGDLRSSLPFSHMCRFMSLQPQRSPLSCPLGLVSVTLCSQPSCVLWGGEAFPGTPCPMLSALAGVLSPVIPAEPHLSDFRDPRLVFKISNTLSWTSLSQPDLLPQFFTFISQHLSWYMDRGMCIWVRIFAEFLSPHLVRKAYEGKNHICLTQCWFLCLVYVPV